MNKKLLEFAGFKYFTDKHPPIIGFRGISYENGWIYPDGYAHLDAPDFTDSLDACFKWLVPRLDYVKISLNQAPSGDVFWNAEVYAEGYLHNRAKVTAETPALALCNAIIKLLDEK